MKQVPPFWKNVLITALQETPLPLDPILHVNQNGLNPIVYLGIAFGHYHINVISEVFYKVLYKIIHRCYPVNTAVRRCTHSGCECTFCKISDEDIEHLYFYCPFSISFWVDFKMDRTKK